jgi:hypothetical protein
MCVAEDERSDVKVGLIDDLRKLVEFDAANLPFRQFLSEKGCDYMCLSSSAIY